MTQEKIGLSCYDCGSDEFTKWDYKMKKCPKCIDTSEGLEEDQPLFIEINDN